MTTINDTYINALLADSSYVKDLIPADTSDNLTNALTGRMTAPLAKYIGDNFSVVTQVSYAGLLASSFDATVWRGNAGTPYAGQVYVSMRGTQEIPDFLADGDLATSGLAHAQLVDMVNWWLRETTPTNQMAKQIVISKTVIGGVTLQNFVAAPDVAGTGTLVGIGPIKSVNGHSLGGYLSSAFVRLFGTQWPVETINTFNSAGFSRPATLNIENGISQITAVIGSSLGLPAFSSAQNNYFAQNGINVTTNTWDPIGFMQYGTRIGMFQEDLTSAIIDNHYMYKLSDLLALGNALAQLDPTLDLTKLSALVSAGSNQMVASYEGVLDALRKMLVGANVSTTLAGDANADNSGPQPASRIELHTNLTALQADPKFLALAGQAQIVAPPTSPTQARTDFGAFLSLAYLTPFALQASGVSIEATLKSANSTLGNQWDADNALTADQIKEGQANYSDLWLADRAAMLSWLNKTYTDDTDVGRVYDGSAWYFKDEASGKQVWVGNPYDVKSNPLLRKVLFGQSGADILTGGGSADHLYGGLGYDTLTGGDGGDYLEGNDGNDTLNGEDGRDTLLGGQGDDTLEGGLDVDRLEGGLGNDSYIIRATDNNDTLEDIDGIGIIQVEIDGALVTLSGGSKDAIVDGRWSTNDGKVSYTFLPGITGIGSLIIHWGTQSLTVQNYQLGQLGLSLTDKAPVAPPVYSNILNLVTPPATTPWASINTWEADLGASPAHPMTTPS